MKMLLIWKRGIIFTLVGIVAFNLIQFLTGFQEPIPSAPMTVPNSALVGADPEPQSSYKLCWDVWSKAVIGISVGIVYMVFVGPLHAVICILDCLGCLCCDPHNGCCCCFCCCGWHDGRDALIGLDEGCCTNCCLHFFPVCTSEECLAYSRCKYASRRLLSVDY